MCKKSFCSMVLFVICLSVVPASGQVDVATATLKGTVTDQKGAVVAGATVTAISIERGFNRVAKTGNDGTYQILLLQPGTYQIQVDADGFAKTLAKGVSLSVGQSLIYDATLGVGGVTQEVSVTADTPLIQAEQTQQANTINQAQIENLPNINRNFTQTVFTLPGVSDAAATRAQNPGYTGFGTTGFSIGGSNGRNNLSTIDGGENEYGTGQYRVATIPVDAIQEFQVNRNAFSAEFGFTVGSSVNIVTKSGTNEFHGSAYGYFRNHSTSAVNYFDQLTTGQKPFSQNLYTGGTFGGPIIKNKLFLFSSYEFQKQDRAGFNFNLNSPNALGINGTTPTGIAQDSYLKMLTAQGGALAALAAGLRPQLNPMNFPTVVKLLSTNDGGFDDQIKSHTWLTRVDFQPNNRDSFNFRFELARSVVGPPRNVNSSVLFTKDYSILGSWARTFGTSLVNQLRVQVVPFNSADQIPNNTTDTNITISGLGSFGQISTIPYLAHQRRFQFEDNLSWSKERHTFKFGASYRPVNYSISDSLYFSGQFDFAAGLIPLISLVPTALQGQVAAFNLANGFPAGGPTAANLSGAQAFAFGIPDFYHGGFGNPLFYEWASYLGSFVQDSWKVTPKLTVDFGGRFDLDVEPAPLKKKAYVSPRFGFAWDPWGKGKTIIRGGAGIFEGPIDVLIPSYGALLDDSGQHINQVLSILSNPLSTVQPTTIYRFGVQQGILPFGQLSTAQINSLGIATGQGNPNRVVFAIDPNYTNPYSIQASLSIQRQLVKDLSLEVGYNLYRGLHLQLPIDTGVKETGVIQPFVGPLYTAIDPTVFQKTTYTSSGKSIYHGLTVSLTKRYSNNLQFQANYTFSKTLDNVIDFNSAFNFFRPTRINDFYGVSVYDFPHVFVANAVYRVPFKSGDGQSVLSRIFADITISPIVTLRSGIPFTITVPGLRNGTNLDNLYATPFGVGRDTSRGESYGTFDMRFQKSMYVNREKRLRIDFIAEGTNLTNRINFNSVNQNFSPVAGPQVVADGSTVNLATGPYNLKGIIPTNANQLQSPLSFRSADSPRQIQLALRFAF